MLTTVLFDLDGTLTDSSVGIYKGVAKALAHFGIEETNEANLARFIGPSLLDSFQRYYGFTEEQAKKAVALYREYYIPKGVYENKPYDGVHEMLETLKSAGLTLCLATAKPEPLAEVVLHEFGLAKYFTHLVGSLYDGTRAEKVDVIAEVLRVTGVSPEEAVMVGDRRHDIEGAKANGLRSVGVLYGFGGREELLDAGADFLAATPAEAAEILLSLRR